MRFERTSELFFERDTESNVKTSGSRGKDDRDHLLKHRGNVDQFRTKRRKIRIYAMLKSTCTCECQDKLSGPSTIGG